MKQPGSVVSLRNAFHYRWGEGQSCDGWHLVQGGGLSIIQERMPPGTAEARHLHRQARQFFYVLRGDLSIEVEGRTHRISAGAGLEIQPGEAHQVKNISEYEAEFLVVSQPPTAGDRYAMPLLPEA